MNESSELEGLINVDNLQQWLDQELPELGDKPLQVERISAGASNEIFTLNRGSETLVLRRPPKHLRDNSNEIMAREYKVLTALGKTNVPHATAKALCEDQSVTGCSFYIMQRIDGFTVRDPLPEPFASNPATRFGLGTELISALANLANVDYAAVGLADLGKPDGFLERQVSRWLSQLAGYKKFDGYDGRDIPGLDSVSDWLQNHIPPMSAPGILHGDYQFANVMFHHGSPAKLAAVVDFEQTTIGDPLLDLGWVLYAWSDAGEPIKFNRYFSAREGLPSRRQLLEQYAEQTGRNLDHIDYYIVLAMFKLAVLMEMNIARAASGKGNPKMTDIISKLVLDLMAEAEALTRQ